MDSTFFLVIALMGIALQLLLVVLLFFDPGLPYTIESPPEGPIGSDEFIRVVSLLADSQFHHDTQVDVLTNGEMFYDAELEAISRARDSISLEAYIFQKGEVAARFIAALTARAQAGVQVRVLLDAIGSFNTWRSTFRSLIDAGGRVEWYIPFRWYNLPRLNHRTHRELIVVDGEIGFVGGAGIADHWYRTKGRHVRWRDTMYRVTGNAVASLQSMFAENWVEASGELLAGSRFYPPCPEEARAVAMVVDSSPTIGRSTRARMLYQTLIACAARSIHLTTPYFLPDESARGELVKAMRDRGVTVQILVPGKHSDHLLTRRSSRRLYGDLLQHGAQIFEYQPSMMHTKALVVDGLWSVVGSTNFDHRSFGLNDELNLVAVDEKLAARIDEDFLADLAKSRRVTHQEWLHRSLLERFNEWLGWLLERQQ